LKEPGLIEPFKVSPIKLELQ